MTDVINDATGYANGAEFTTDQEVRDYFTEENMRWMFDGDANIDTLDEWANWVISNQSHMTAK